MNGATARRRSGRSTTPAEGFYEWRSGAHGPRQAFYIRRIDRRPLALGGLWTTWRDPDVARHVDEPLRTTTILTTSPNGLMSQIHDRMPVVIAEGALDAWLDPSFGDTAALRAWLQPAPDDLLEAIPVGAKVGNARRRETRSPPPSVERNGRNRPANGVGQLTSLITRVVNPALARNLDSGHRAPLRLTPAATFVMARWRGSPNPGSAHSGIPDSRGSEFSIPTRLTERLAVLWDWIGRSIDPLFLTPEKFDRAAREHDPYVESELAGVRITGTV